MTSRKCVSGYARYVSRYVSDVSRYISRSAALSVSHALTPPLCRMRQQEVARGSASQELEYPVERMVQQFKIVNGRQVSANPEASFANKLLIDKAVHHLGSH